MEQNLQENEAPAATEASQVRARVLWYIKKTGVFMVAFVFMGVGTLVHRYTMSQPSKAIRPSFANRVNLTSMSTKCSFEGLSLYAETSAALSLQCWVRGRTVLKKCLQLSVLGVFKFYIC